MNRYTKAFFTAFICSLAWTTHGFSRISEPREVNVTIDPSVPAPQAPIAQVNIHVLNGRFVIAFSGPITVAIDLKSGHGCLNTYIPEIPNIRAAEVADHQFSLRIQGNTVSVTGEAPGWIANQELLRLATHLGPSILEHGSGIYDPNYDQTFADDTAPTRVFNFGPELGAQEPTTVLLGARLQGIFRSSRPQKAVIYRRKTSTGRFNAEDLEMRGERDFDLKLRVTTKIAGTEFQDPILTFHEHSWWAHEANDAEAPWIRYNQPAPVFASLANAVAAFQRQVANPAAN